MMVEINRFKVDKPVAHLGVVGASRGLQLQLDIIHHHNLLTRHGLLEQRVLGPVCIVVARVLLLLLQVGKA